MKIIATSSFFVLFALVAGLVATTPVAFADHSEVTVEPAMGSGVIGCEEEPDGCYIPTTASVDVGGVVIFSNTDNVAHTFTSGTTTGGPDGIFDSGLVITGQSYQYDATEAGEFPYFCIVHPWMVGTIVVNAEGSMEMKDDKHDDKMDGMKDDKHGDDRMDGMKYDPSATGMLSDGTMVSVWTTVPMAGEMFEAKVKFDAEHVNYDIMIMQDGEEILHDEGVHNHGGKMTHTTPMMLDSDAPVDISITFMGYGVDEPYTGPTGEMVTFTNIVPEFGTIAMLVLTVAIISIIAVTAKSRVIPRL